MVYLVPFNEMSNVFERVYSPMANEYSTAPIRQTIGDEAGRPVFNAYRCPSSVMANTHCIAEPGSMIADYVAIAGAVDGFGGLVSDQQHPTNFGPPGRNGSWVSTRRTSLPR